MNKTNTTAKNTNLPPPNRKVNFAAINRKISPPANQSNGRPRQERNNAATDISDIEVLPGYEAVLESVREKAGPVFVTGSAGTGKSTLIRYLRSQLRLSAVVAPTAVAAMNVEGTTIHSFFGIPARTVEPEEVFTPRNQMKPVIANLDVLIIDEVSMVTPNLIDCMSNCLREARERDEPFGGVSVVFIGDLLQLRPVVPSKGESRFYNQRYGNCFFFSAEVFKQNDVAPFELTKPFRQQGEDLLAALDNIRTGQNIEEAIEYFNNRCIRNLETSEKDAMYLVPKRAQADAVNAEKLAEIKAMKRTYDAKFEGSFKGGNGNEMRLPAPEKLILKPGARVVFLKNNQPDWINGTGAEVTKLEEDNVRVRILENGGSVSVPRETWYKYAYWYDERAERIKHEIAGSFTQFPMMLAWAMTIHRSQGMTLDSVRIDLGEGAFCSGQTYVALSRCRTVEGITLEQRIRKGDVKVDPAVLGFYRESGFLKSERKE